MQQETSLSYNPTMPLPRGHRLYTNPSAQVYFYKYITAPTSHAFSGLIEHEDVIGALSRLDADCKLSQRVRKTGRYLHSIEVVRRLR